MEYYTCLAVCKRMSTLPLSTTTNLAHTVSCFLISQEVIFDKTKGTVSLMNTRFLEKHLLGYRRKSECQSVLHALCLTQLTDAQYRHKALCCMTLSHS